MYNFIRNSLFSFAVLASGSLHAATVDLNGRTYQVASPDNVAIAAKLGESTTVSFAYKISDNFETVFDNAIASGSKYFFEEYQFLEGLSVRSSSNSAFSINVQRQSLAFENPLYNGPRYLRFDLTFAPTASTLGADYEVVNSDPMSPRVFRADLYTEFGFTDYVILGPDDAATRQAIQNNILVDGYDRVFTYKNYIVGDILSNESLGPDFALFGTVLPESTSVTPVPIPGSLAMMGLGLLGLGALKRRKS